MFLNRSNVQITSIAYEIHVSELAFQTAIETNSALLGNF